MAALRHCGIPHKPSSITEAPHIAPDRLGSSWRAPGDDRRGGSEASSAARLGGCIASGPGPAEAVIWGDVMGKQEYCVLFYIYIYCIYIFTYNVYLYISLYNILGGILLSLDVAKAKAKLNRLGANISI